MIILLSVIAVVLIVIDQLVKLWAVDKLQPAGTMDFIKVGDFKILDLTYLENDGAIFGSMSGQRWFLIGFTSLFLIIAIVAMVKAAKRSKFLSTAIMLYVAGGIGNLIDRARYGYVVDMFEIKLFRFAIFNVADICVTFAFILAIIYVLIVEPKREKEAKPEEKAADNE